MRICDLFEGYPTYSLLLDAKKSITRAITDYKKKPDYNEYDMTYELPRIMARRLLNIVRPLLKQYPIISSPTFIPREKPAIVEISLSDYWDSINGLFDPDGEKIRVKLTVPTKMFIAMVRDVDAAIITEMATWFAHELTHLINDSVVSNVPTERRSEIADKIEAGIFRGTGWVLRYRDKEKLKTADIAMAVRRGGTSGDNGSRWLLRIIADATTTTLKRMPIGSTPTEEQDYLIRRCEIEAFASQAANELLLSVDGDVSSAVQLIRDALNGEPSKSRVLGRYLTHLKGTPALRTFLTKLYGILKISTH